MAPPDQWSQPPGPEDAPTAVDPAWPGERTLVAPDEPLPPAPPPAGPPPPGPPDGRSFARALAWGLVILLLLVAAGIGAAVLLDRHHERKPGAAGGSRPAGTAPTPTRARTSTGRPTPRPRPRSAVVDVPGVVGAEADAARARVHAVGLGAHLQPEHSTSAAGTVTGQLPPAGSKLRRGSAITLLVSSGPKETPSPRVAVPSVVGLGGSDAAARLSAAGLEPRTRTNVSTRPAGTVLSQSPAAGSRVAPYAPVVLVVAKAPPKTMVPDLVGKTRLRALGALRRAHLGSRVHLVPSQETQRGTVVAQYPQAGLVVPRGRAVRINVGIAPRRVGSGGGATQATVPDVTSLDDQQAASELENAGFTAQSTDRTVTDQSEDGTVLDQSPAGGTRARTGATVTIVVGRYSG